MGRIDGVSDAGAVGPMQFLPTTWAECCTGDPTVTRDAIIGAATYLAQSGAPGDMQAAVHQYNPNDSYVAIVTAYAETLRDQPLRLSEPIGSRLAQKKRAQSGMDVNVVFEKGFSGNRQRQPRQLLPNPRQTLFVEDVLYDEQRNPRHAGCEGQEIQGAVGVGRQYVGHVRIYL